MGDRVSGRQAFALGWAVTTLGLSALVAWMFIDPELDSAFDHYFWWLFGVPAGFGLVMIVMPRFRGVGTGIASGAVTTLVLYLVTVLALVFTYGT